MSKKETSIRTRNYATIIYPDSAPSDWKEKLMNLHIPAFISPLHDKDTNPDGTLKKPHYHVLLLFDGVKSKKQVSQMLEEIGAVGLEVVHSSSGYARYLIHADNPEKAPYPEKDVIALSGANYAVATYVPVDDLSIVADMIKFIFENHITSFAEFTNICTFNNPEWLRVLVLKKTSYFFIQYIKSFAQNIRDY